MATTSNTATRPGEGPRGDARELAERLGGVRGLALFGTALAAPLVTEVADRRSLNRFLQDYVARVLVPAELPVVLQSFEHACRYEIRELIALDYGLVLAAVPEAFLEASRRVGRSQLRRLRPLRDERRVQRYWQAVVRGEAHAWHTVVYGLALALYSLPLRQGLMSYGAQTVRGFAESAGERLGLGPAERAAMARRATAALRPAVEGLLLPAAARVP